MQVIARTLFPSARLINYRNNMNFARRTLARACFQFFQESAFADQTTEISRYSSRSLLRFPLLSKRSRMQRPSHDDSALRKKGRRSLAPQIPPQMPKNFNYSAAAPSHDHAERISEGVATAGALLPGRYASHVASCIIMPRYFHRIQNVQSSHPDCSTGAAWYRKGRICIVHGGCAGTARPGVIFCSFISGAAEGAQDAITDLLRPSFFPFLFLARTATARTWSRDVS